MAEATLTSPCNTNKFETLACEENSTHLRDASFSLNLNNSNEPFVLKLAGNLSPTVAIPKDHLYQMNLGRKKTESGETSVFTAEKYFNGGINEKTQITDKGGRKRQPKKDEKHDLQSLEPKIKPRNRSSSSSVLKDWSPSEQKKVNGRRFFTSFGCKCTCTDEKSIDIKENIGENKNSSNSCRKNVDYGGVDDKEIKEVANEIDQQQVSFAQNPQTQPESSSKEEISCQKFDNLGVGLQAEDSFNLPVLNSEVGNVTVGTQFEEKARKSLEVFGSPIIDKDISPRVMEIPKFTVSSGMFYDVESNSSSDLFEIKNLLDNFSTLPNNDEPKMAGIIKNPKKVIKKGTTTTTTKTKTTSAKNSIGKKMQRHGDSILLSCRSHKAVKVVGNTYRIAEKAKSDSQMHQRSDFVTPMSELRTDQAKVRDFKTARVRHALARKSFS